MKRWLAIALLWVGVAEARPHRFGPTAQAGGSPTVVAGFPVSADNTTNGVSSFTVTLAAAQAGDLVLLFVGLNGTDLSAQTLAAPTPSSATLTWTFVTRSNAFSSGTQGGDAEVWQAVVPGGGLGAGEVVTVKTISSITSNFPHGTAVAVAFHGASSTVRTAVAQSSTSAVPQVAVTGTTAGSLIYAVGSDWSAGTVTAQAGDTIDHPFTSAGAVTAWAEHQTAASAGGSVTLGIQTARAGWNMVGVEILAGP